MQVKSNVIRFETDAGQLLLTYDKETTDTSNVFYVYASSCGREQLKELQIAIDHALLMYNEREL